VSEPRYVPAHHPMCSCELCMLAFEGTSWPPEPVRRQAVAWMNRHGKVASSRQERTEERGAMAGMLGKTVRFQWAHRTPDLVGGLQSPWNAIHEAHVQAIDRGAVLLAAEGVRPRWWPVRAFAWIEALEVTA